MKRYRGLMILTTLLTLLPALVGVLLWDKLPDQIPIHWNMAGEIDGWTNKQFAVFGLCGILAALHILCSLITFADPKNKGHNEKKAWIALWITPIISILCGCMTYGAALGYEIRVEQILPIFMGGLFTFTGNVMPKFKQNSTIGIKIPWTLHDEENWTATHRFTGPIWMVCGLVIMVSGFLNSIWLMLGAILVMTIVPVLYSYRFYKKKFG